MNIREKEFEYDVALSFAGEDREYVDNLAEKLKSMGIKVFYDKFETAKLWGKDLYQFLSSIYKDNARYCIIFISEHYKEKAWTTLELRNAQNRALFENREYILPIYLEDVKLNGINDTIGFLKATDYSYDEIVNLTLEKLGIAKTNLKDNSKITSVGKMAIETIKEFLETWKNLDFHSKDKRVDIEKIYLLYKANFNKYNCTGEIIDIGYLLTDIFERDMQYDKSLQIAKQLLGYYDLSEERIELFNKEYIRKMIGCAYSIAIAKVPDIEKGELLKESKILFNKTKELCKNYYNSASNSLGDKEFLWGLYYSDHGAYFLNEGDSNKKKLNDREARQAYELALEEYKQSLEHRKILLGTIDDGDSVLIQEAKNMIARSISNMGVALFRLERYRESIEKHEEALKHFTELKDKDRECRTKEYIIGSFIELCQKDNDEWFLKDLRKCQKYLEELINYYGDVSNLKDKKNKLAEIEESFFKAEH